MSNRIYPEDDKVRKFSSEQFPIFNFPQSTGNSPQPGNENMLVLDSFDSASENCTPIKHKSFIGKLSAFMSPPSFVDPNTVDSNSLSFSSSLPNSNFVMKSNAPLSTRKSVRTNAQIAGVVKELDVIQEVISAKEVENTRILFDYLTENGTSISANGDKDELRTFGELVTACLEDLSSDCVLAELLNEYGWSGINFMYVMDMNYTALQQALGSLYMISKQKLVLSEAQRYNPGCLVNPQSPNYVQSPLVSAVAGATGNISAMNSPVLPGSEGAASEVHYRFYNEGCDQAIATGRGIGHTESVISFIPDAAVNLLLGPRLDMMPRGRLEPCKDTFFGVSLLADISGFTKLSSNFCLRGSAGLDDLHSVTSGFLGRLVRLVYWFDGDVIAFAGDALVCVFKDPGATDDSVSPFSGIEEVPDANVDMGSTMGRKRYINSKDNATSKYFLKALYAALCLVCCETAELTAHAALSCGEMSIAALGGYQDEWTYLLNGSCISELACINDAKAKEVVVTPRLYSMLTSLDSNLGELNVPYDVVDFSLSNISKLPSGNYLIKSLYALPNTGRSLKCVQVPDSGQDLVHLNKGNPTTQLRAIDRATTTDMVLMRYSKYSTIRKDDANTCSLFMPLTIANYEDAEDAEVVVSTNPELREVTTVFVNFDSYSKEEYADPLKLQPFFLLAQAALLETDGFLRQFLIDDKGCVLIAMWGVPAFTFPNNGSRALYFARTFMHKVHSQLGQRCSIGITTGMVYCGTIGSIIRRDYVAIGHTVNLSARLMGKAKGRILVDSTTYQLLPVENRELLSAGEELQLKGVVGVMRPYVAVPMTEDERFNMDVEDVGVNGEEPMIKKNVGLTLKALVDKMSEPPVGQSFVDSLETSEKSRTNRAGNSFGGRKEVSAKFSKNRASETSLNRNAGNSFGGRKENSVSGFKYVQSENSASRRAGNSFGGRKEISISFSQDRWRGGVMPDENSNSRFLLKDKSVACNGKVSYVIVKGTAGLGKSSAAKYMRFRAKQRNFRYVYVQAKPADVNVPFGVLKSIVVQLIGESYFKEEENQISVMKYIIEQSCPKVDAPNMSKMLSHMNALLKLKWSALNIAKAAAARRRVPFAQNSINGASVNSDWDEPKAPQRGFSIVNIRQSVSAVAGMLRASVSGNANENFAVSSAMEAARNAVNPSLSAVNENPSEDFDNYVGSLSMKTKQKHSATLSPSRSNNDSMSFGMKELLFHLLLQKKTVIIVDDGHNCDRSSVAALFEIKDEPVWCTVFFTKLTVNVGGYDVATPTITKMSSRRRFTVVSSGDDENDVPEGSPNPIPPKASVNRLSFRQQSNLGRGGGFDALQEISKFSRTTTIELTPLVHEEVSDLLVSYFRKSNIDREWPSSLVSVVLDVSSGNPFWCNTIAKHIVDNGFDEFIKTMQEFEPADASVGASSAKKNPLSTLILCRLDALPSSCQVVLKYASIIGEEVSKQELEAVVPASVSTDVELTELVAQGFLYNTDFSRYAFHNRIIRDAIAEIMPPR